MDAYDPEAGELGQSERPRRVLIRASLEQGREACDVELKRLERSPEAADSAEAHHLVKAIALPASPDTVASVQDWDHANASFWLRASEARKEAFAYNHEMLLVAASVCAAELEVRRSYPVSLMEEHISKLLTAANGRWVSSGSPASFMELRGLADFLLAAPSRFAKVGA